MNKYKKSKKILHIITGLNNGGAEAVLYRLCTNDSENQHAVISLMDLGKYGPLLLDSGIDVYTLKMPQGKVTFSGLRNLYRLIKKQKPDVVQTWMYHADLIGGVIARLAGIKNVFWNIRNTILDEKTSSKSTIYIARLCSLFSHFIPRKIICCANKALEYHVELGYKKAKMLVIGNGYELDKLVVNRELGLVVRSELLIKNDEVVLGMVGRYAPAKDHSNLLSALTYLKSINSNFKFILVGKSLSMKNKVLVKEIEKLDLQRNVLLLEQRTDIPAVMNAIDIHVLSSYSEAFPNVLAEAMACGIPCVTTDVGDASIIVGDTGWVVPTGNSKVLGDAIAKAVSEISVNDVWQARKVAARSRIVKKFSIQKMIDGYKTAWSD